MNEGWPFQFYLTLVQFIRHRAKAPWHELMSLFVLLHKTRKTRCLIQLQSWTVIDSETWASALPSKCVNQTHYMTSDTTNDWFEAYCPEFHVDYEPIRSTDVSLLQLNNKVNMRELHLALGHVINYRLIPWSNLSHLLTSLCSTFSVARGCDSDDKPDLSVLMMLLYGNALHVHCHFF